MGVADERGGMTAGDDVASVLEVIGHEDRLAIVEALIEARRSEGDPFLRFTDLRDRAGIDDTGRFNYHLDQLRETFVTKSEEGYRLTSYAHRITAPMMGGLYDSDRASDGIETDGSCPDCDAGLRIEPDGTVLQVVCERGHVVNHGLLGYPGVLGDRPPEDANRTLGLLNAQGVELAASGVCPTCHGPVDGGLVRDDDAGYYLFEAPCSTCGNQFANTVGGCVLFHPAVVSFMYDHGVDVRDRIPWSLSFVYPGRETVESTDPLRLSVDVTVDDAVLTVTVDRDANVVSTARSDA